MNFGWIEWNEIINIVNHQNSSKIQSECILLNDVFHNRRLGMFTSTKLREFLMAMQRASFVLKHSFKYIKKVMLLQHVSCLKHVPRQCHKSKVFNIGRMKYLFWSPMKIINFLRCLWLIDIKSVMIFCH